MNLVTYDDKVALNVNSQIADINKVTADDMNAIKNALNNLIFPVGSIIYNSSADFDPNTVYGGTWERIKGKLIFGVDEADNDFSTSGKTGGEKEHNHVENVFAYNGKLAVSNTDIAAETSKSMIYTVNGTTGFTPVSGTQKGDAYRTEKSSNMPPYQTAYIWERTA